MERFVKVVGFFTLGVALVACAPVSSKSIHGKYAAPVTGSISIHKNTVVRVTPHVVRNYSPVEVSLHGDHVMAAFGFNYFRFVISDNEYVELPGIKRKGWPAKVFAHYHKGVIHFDHNRNCRTIVGAPRFVRHQNWESGHRYSHSSAGYGNVFLNIDVEIRDVYMAAGPKQYKVVRPVKTPTKVKKTKSHIVSNYEIDNKPESRAIKKGEPRPRIVEKVILGEKKTKKAVAVQRIEKVSRGKAHNKRKAVSEASYREKARGLRVKPVSGSANLNNRVLLPKPKHDSDKLRKRIEVSEKQKLSGQKDLRPSHLKGPGERGSVKGLTLPEGREEKQSSGHVSVQSLGSNHRTERDNRSHAKRSFTEKKK